MSGTNKGRRKAYIGFLEAVSVNVLTREHEESQPEKEEQVRVKAALI